MRINRAIIIVSFLAVIFLSGCVVGRRTIDLEIPSKQGDTSKNASVTVVNVEDFREFLNNPAQPSIPSIDGDYRNMSKLELSGMIGRQRNGFGKAMGDIGLPSGITVQDKTRLLIEEGLKARGYTIGDSPDSDYQVDVKIEEFWAWFTPGMWALSFEARIKCIVTIKGETKVEEITVTGYGKNSGQVASDPNWQLAYTRAFESFLLNFNAELDARGF